MKKGSNDKRMAAIRSILTGYVFSSISFRNFSAKSARLVAREIGVEVAFVDPMAQNWSVNLREVAIKFRNAME